MVLFANITLPSKIGIFDLFSDHIYDFSLLSDETTYSYKYVEGGTGDYDWNETTQTFSYNEGAGDYDRINNTIYYPAGTTDVDAEIISSDIYIEGITGEFSLCRAFLRTGVHNNTFSVETNSDTFTPADSYDVDMNFYIDTAELNTGVASSRVGGTRNGVLHEIPLHGGQGQGHNVKISCSNEGEFYELRLVPVNYLDRSQG